MLQSALLLLHFAQATTKLPGTSSPPQLSGCMCSATKVTAGSCGLPQYQHGESPMIKQSSTLLITVDILIIVDHSSTSATSPSTMSSPMSARLPASRENR